MTSLLAIIKEPERGAMQFERLVDHFAGLNVVTVADSEAAAPHLAATDILITIGPQLGTHAQAGAVYEAAHKLKWIQSYGSGVDNIVGHPSLRADVAVTNLTGVHGAQMSEAAFAAMLTLARDVPRLVRNQDKAAWDRFPPRLLSGKTVLIIGLGAIANDLAPRCTAFGMRVVGVSSNARVIAGFDVVHARADMLSAVSIADYVVVLTPHSPETHHMIGADFFKAMKPTASLINLARGGVVDEAALLVALDADELAGAALDVFEAEPLPADHPLWAHRKVFITPHIGGFHEGYPDQVRAVVIENLTRYFESGTANLINRVQ